MNLIHKVPLIIEPAMDSMKELLSGQMALKGMVTCEHYRHGGLIHEQTGFNTFTTEGMAKICNIIFGVTAKTGAIGTFVGLFKNNIVPAVGDTAAKLGSGNAYGECQDADYTPATSKPNYTTAVTTTAGCTNAASKAEFTMAAAITVYGAFISMVAAKTDVVGPLICAKKLTTARATEIGDVLAISYVVSLTTS
jgi:hypothetical protein